MRLLRRIAKEQGRSVVIVSHDERIRDIADRVLWLEDGAFKDIVTMATDPVCSMAVERERAVSAERDGETYWFCSRGCREEFLGGLPPDHPTDCHGFPGLVRAATALLSRRSSSATDRHQAAKRSGTSYCIGAPLSAQRRHAMERDLSGKVAIVTGGARGIGAATAEAMAAAGVAVVVTDVLDEEGERMASHLRDGGYTARYEHLDVSDEANWDQVVEKTVAELGGLHVLVNNAGIGTLPDVETETREGWDRLIAINQTGVWLGMKTAAPRMRASGGGSIVNVSSIFGAVGGFGGSIAYHASKGAVRLMTKNAAIRYAKEGIRVNSVHPGFIDTPMIEQVKDTPVEQAILANTPMGRLGTPAEIGAVIAFLASDAASYMTGSEVYVDGGWTAQ